MAAQVARGTGEARRRTWTKVVPVTLAAAITAMVVGPLLWPTSDPPLFPDPSAAQLPFFVILQVVTCLTFGLGVAFLLFGQPRPLKIGSLKNVSTKTTQLVGKVVSGSAFAVNNPSGGPALGLQVNAGQAPLTVNAEAGKATNLDADKLGGKDSTDFYAAGSKVADADTVDGKDSTDFLASGCRSDFTTFAEGRPCVSQLMGDNTFYGGTFSNGTFSNGAVSTCRDMGARIGNSNDVMLTFTDPTFNYFAGFESGWLADRFGNDVWGTWNVSNPPADGNFDGGPEHAQFVQLPYRCVY